ncbi:jg22348 [Pararge aegeria aegeria]|uniref:Jg22348 protein n=1 Tax=Pararge aegeria aegeria TaxID=348720 RepID=A0A8S4R095_9NEOP|nr:jg22348 [Pararge aegeria aegeria]
MMGLPSILVQQLKRNDSDIKVDLDTESWIASVHGFAGIPSIFIPYLMQCWGRRFGFRCSCLSVLIGWIILCFANSSLTIIMAEIFQGAGIKSLLVVCMVTISEMVEPKIRNQSIVSYGIIQTFIVLFVPTAGNFLHWKTISLILCFPLALAIIFSFIWPESPAWLAYKGRFEESKKSFIWLRGKNKESLAEMNALFIAQREFLNSEMTKESPKRSRLLLRAAWQKISRRDFYLPIFHMFVLLSCYYWSGNLLIVVYHPLLERVIENSESAFIAMISIVVAFIIGNVVGIVATDSSLCLYPLLGFTVCSSTAFYMVPFGVSTEIIPLRHRGVAGSVYIILMSISYTISLKIAPYLIDHLGTYGIFLLYAFILSLCLTWIWKYVPETKNKTLQTIEETFVGSYKDPSVVIDEGMNESYYLNDKE